MFLHFAGQREPIGGIKGENNADYKDSNIQNCIIFSQNSGIGEKEDRNKKCTKQNSGGKAGKDARIIVL